MIVGIGIDLCEETRIAEAIERHGQAFLNRLFSDAEQALAASQRSPDRFYAGRFAAKEACVKALGSGITDRVRWTDVAILLRPSGQPYCDLAGNAARRAKRLVGRNFVPEFHVSISRYGDYVHAFVIFEALPK